MTLGIVTTITALLIISLLIFYFLFRKYSSNEKAAFLGKALIVSVFNALILVSISFSNRYFYLFTVIFLFFLSAYNSSKAFKSAKGYIVVGLYISFWLSLPLSLYFAFSKY